MKKVRIIVALVLMVVLAITTAAATSTNFTGDGAVYVDSERVNVDAKVDADGEVYVESKEALYTILPELEDGNFRINTEDWYRVSTYVLYLDGYSYTFRNNAIYIYSGDIDIGDLIDDGNSNEDSQKANVFANDLRIATQKVTLENGVAYASEKDVRLIFTEAQGAFIEGQTSLQRLANHYGYVLKTSGNDVYLNNNGNAPVKVFVNGEETYLPDQQAFIQRDRTMVPVRFITEEVGAQVLWNQATRTVTISKNGTTINMAVGQKEFMVNGVQYTSDIAPMISNGRTMVPVRFVTENLGFAVQYETGYLPVVRLTSR